MTRLIFFALLLSAPGTRAQTSEAPVVRPLYQLESFLPGTLIPFQIRGDHFQQGAKLVSVKTDAPAQADCRTMMDPFHQDVFHLKCAGETDSSFSLTIRYEKNNVLYTMEYHGVRVRMPSSDFIVVPPTVSVDPDFVAGRNLFNAYCLSCHTPAQKKGVKATDITRAINNDPSMRTISGLKGLSATDLQKLEAYLKTGGK